MADSPGGDEETKTTHERFCDSCGELRALVYCRADTAKLCFSCDREVHSANPLFTKHTRWQLCDSCDSNPASIRCSTENLVLCQNCDWESHGKKSLSSLHDRRPLEGFSGCPSAIELSSILGFEDVKNKSLLLFEDDDDSCLVGSGIYGDGVMWETPSFVNLDDLIVSMDSNHDFQAMGIRPPPKNRNAVCGKHKEEILCQLRNLVKLEPLNDDHREVDSFLEFQPHMSTYFKHDVNPIVLPGCEESAFQWNGNSGEAGDLVPTHYPLMGNHTEDSFLVLDKPIEVSGSRSHANASLGEQSQHPTIRVSLPGSPRVTPYELNSQERDSVILRYKEKKKTRRFDNYVRYESRKARAESRTRIKGRFAKVNH